MVAEKKLIQTEIGLIPEDWKVLIFNDFSDKLKKWSITGGPFGSNLKTNDYTSDGIQIIQLQNIGDGKFINDSKVYTSTQKANELLSCNIYPGEIILSKMGDPVARACIIPNHEERFLMASDGIRLVVDSKQYDNKFVFHYINSPFFRNRAIEISTGSTRQRIGLPELKCLKVIKPPLPEQQAIAEALSDADAWIESLEKLIAKKRLIKQGAMQELLSPKEDWEVKKLGEVACYRRGSFPQPYGLDKWYDDNNGMPFIQVFDVDKNRKLKIDTKRKISILAQAMSVFVPKGTIVLTIQGSIGRIALTQYDAYCDRTLLIFEKINDCLEKFFFLLSVEQIFEIEKERAPGGTIKTITKEALSDFDIAFPKSLEEQSRIATILSDMDTELEALEKQLEKARQIKQGMMQELLTGRVRLV
ncbi:restriction endonuclease subunit S [Flavobacterium oreochromis]|uniref:restriction endonuclease subunit S n=1 Tax=Flavobacterium oreochromis TaxID=2906078 RepID=UPI003859E975